MNLFMYFLIHFNKRISGVDRVHDQQGTRNVRRLINTNGGSYSVYRDLLSRQMSLSRSFCSKNLFNGAMRDVSSYTSILERETRGQPVHVTSSHPAPYSVPERWREASETVGSLVTMYFEAEWRRERWKHITLRKRSIFVSRSVCASLGSERPSQSMLNQVESAKVSKYWPSSTWRSINYLPLTLA